MARYTAATYRRRRILWTLALSALGLLAFVYNYGFNLPSSFSLSRFSESEVSDGDLAGQRRIRVQEIHGLLRLVAQTSGTLPTDGSISGTEEVSLSTFADLAGGDDDWLKHVTKLRRETPLVVFSKTYCPYSKRAKALLETYALVPPPKIVEVDIRPDGQIIQNILARLTDRRTVPNVLVHGDSIGGSDDIHELHEKGELREILETAGIKVKGKV